MKPILLTIFCFVTAVAEANAETNYRDYLHGIAGFSNWFRIGTYKLQDRGIEREVDLYYSDSDDRPDGNEIFARVIPNGFGLYCVWKTSEGNWSHKEVAGRARVGFSKIVSTDKSALDLELYVKRVYRADVPEERKRWRSILNGETDDSFRLRLSFVDGQPLTAEITAEQGGTGQPATRPESNSEGGDKPQPESEGRSR